MTGTSPVVSQWFRAAQPLRWTMLGVCVLLAAACAGPAVQDRGPVVQDRPQAAPTDREQDRAPDHVPFDLATLPDPVPKREPPSRYGNHSPYTVWGRSYEVMAAADGYEADGIASWYGQKFHGRRTSSGEPYDMYQLTAAHRYLPLPSYARVTNLENGRTVIVRVNDRGPFHEDRLIDLSYAAAVRLGFVEQGTARVNVEVVVPDSVPALERTASTSGGASEAGDDQIFLQAGAFASRDAANRLKAALAATVDAAILVRDGDSLFRVWIGPFAHVAEAARIQDLLAAAEFGRPVVVRD